jgi:hypothetical protein
MYQIFTKMVAGTNSCKAMERETILKSRISPKNDRSRITSKYMLLLFFIGCLVFSSCVTTAKVAKARDFTLTTNTPIAVQSIVYPEAGMAIEEMLLEKGYNVVPYEVALDKTTTDFNISRRNRSVDGSVSTYNARYIPAAIVITVSMKFTYYPAATYFDGGYIRILDLTDKRLLVSFRYKGGAWTVGNLDSVLNQFVKDFSALVQR